MESRPALALLFVLLYLLLCAAVWWRHRRLARAVAAQAAALLPTADAGPPVLVLHASQTGQAEALAWHTGRFLHLAGMPVRVAALGEVSAQDLQSSRHLLVIASTYGEGDAPDSAAPFARDLMGTASGLDLRHLQIGVMALGDATYAHYCGFGRAVHAWLLQCGAQPLFDRIDVDREDPAALSLWQQRLSHVAGTADLPEAGDWSGPAFERWRLIERRHLNPGSQGGPVFHLALVPPPGQPLPAWEAGDLVQVLPEVMGEVESGSRSSSLPDSPARSPSPSTTAVSPASTTVPEAERARPREYTIASMPGSGRVELLVRQTRRDDGQMGQASGLLTSTLPMGGEVSLRLRAHPSFRIGDNQHRPLILIGNGTGLAGLRAHLKAREDAAMSSLGARQPTMVSQAEIVLADGGDAEGLGPDTDAWRPAAPVPDAHPEPRPAPAWLIFGERQSAHDALYRDEIDAWLQGGLLRHADLAFSRDQAERLHVQHLLSRHAQRLREWVADGAAIYVCGSLQGMAGAVDAVLREVLGESAVDALLQQGRYRRDVY